MNIKALVTSLLIASSTTAALADDLTATNFYGDRMPDRYGEMRRPTRLTWQPLTQVITAQRSNVIKLDERRDDLHALRLQNGTGATYVYSLTLRYDDGSRENITVGKWLWGGVPQLTFDLPQDRDGVASVAVNTWTYTPSTFQVMGQLGRNRVDRPDEPQFPTPPPMPPINQSLSLGTNLTFANTAGYIQIPVGEQKGSFSKLEIRSAGQTYLGRVYISFPGGAYQTINVNKALVNGQVISLDIEGNTDRAIAAVTVMAGDDIHVIGQNPSRFALTLR